MAVRIRNKKTDIKNKDLEKNIREKTTKFSFIQIVRLFKFLSNEDLTLSDFVKNNLRIKPLLSLGFPGTDVISMNSDNNHLELTTTFLGLYGPASPLPTFYTEELIEEYIDGGSVKKDFMDIFNIVFFELFFNVITKYHLIYKLADDKNEEYADRIYSLMGLGSSEIRESMPEREDFMKYAGIFLHQSKSVSGLESIIKDYFNIKDIKIEEFIKRIVKIDRSQQCFLGSKNTILSDNCHIGSKKTDFSGKIAIDLGQLDKDKFHSFLPSGKNFKVLSKIVNFYMDRPVDVEIRMSPAKDKFKSASLSSDNWGQLGYNTWIFSKNQTENRFKASFNLPARSHIN